MMLYYLVTLALLISGMEASPKKYNGDYYDNQVIGSASNNQTKEKIQKSADAKESRFGISTYNTVTDNYGNIPYGITPMKIDIGGIALGALIGLGAVLIVPKLAHVFSNDGYGYRSLESNISSFTDVLHKIDDTLAKNNIDSGICMQQLICSAIKDAKNNVENGSAGTMDSIVTTLYKNSAVSTLVDQTPIKRAIELGEQGDENSCESLKMKCPINRSSILQLMNVLL